MPQDSLFLQITDGTTSVTLSSGTATPGAIQIEQDVWAPNVARRRPNNLGGSSRYTEVEETIPLFIRNPTAAATMDTVADLERLIDQAEAWGQGRRVAPVTLHYAPIGSVYATTAAPYKALITGLIDAETSPLSLPPASEGTRGRGYLRGMPLRFRRRGLWLLPEEASNAVSGFRSYDKAALTFATSLPGDYHPVRLEITGLSSYNGDWYDGYILFAPSGDHLLIVEAEAVYTSGTSVSGTSTLARGGSTRTITGLTGGSAFSVGAAIGASSLISVFAGIMQLSGAFETWARVYFADSSVAESVRIPVTGPRNAVVPYDRYVLAYPPIAVGRTVASVEVFFSGAGELSIDYVCVAGDAQIVRVASPVTYATTAPIVLHVDHQALTGIRPAVQIISNSATVTLVPASGDAYATSGGNALGVAWLQTERGANSLWALSSAGVSTSAKTHSIQAHRRRAFVIPE